jgi:hypothetical protein
MKSLFESLTKSDFACSKPSSASVTSIVRICDTFKPVSEPNPKNSKEHKIVIQTEYLNTGSL